MNDVRVELAADGEPTRRQIARWRRYLANERAEAAVYRELARKRDGEERAILLEMAEAEARHEAYWRDRLGNYVGMPRSPDLNTRFLGFMARHFGSVFALALLQSAETRTPYLDDADAPAHIAADENLHAEVVRALAAKGREQMSGGFRAAVFGANDGLVSNAALVLGVIGSGMDATAVTITGVSGLLAGALSMAAGEYISVRSQTELLEASTPNPNAHQLVADLDVNANELALVYRARGMTPEEASRRAGEVFAGVQPQPSTAVKPATDGASAAWTAAGSSFVAFSLGALIPILPFLCGLSPLPGAVVALTLVAMALLFTGGVVGVLSGKAPLPRALRQLAIGLGAALVTFGLGLLFGWLLA